MGYLVILRGTSACGKTTMAKKLQEYLGKEKTSFVNLDRRPDLEELDLINTENCIAEMFYGDQYTREPEIWIPVIKAKGFTIKSVILKASLGTCLERNKHKKKPLPEDVVRSNYLQYIDEYQPLDSHIKEFSRIAKVQEIEIDVDKLDVDTIAKKIMEFIEKKVL